MGEAPAPSAATSRRLAELGYADFTRLLADLPVAYVPSGTIEWHSHHLPIGLDGLVAGELCLRAANAGGIVVPTTYWAIGGVPYPATMRFPEQTIEDLFIHMTEQLEHIGFRCVFILAGHYGIDHYTALKRAAVTVMRRSNLIICPIAEFELVTDHGFVGGDHAGAWETSLLWALRPELVTLDQVPPTTALDGVLGEDPRSGASPARGQALADLLVERMAAMTRRLVTDPPATRSAHLDALTAQLTILEHIRADRARLPRARVRPLMTASYLRFLDSFWRGDYQGARQAADATLGDLAASAS